MIKEQLVNKHQETEQELQLLTADNFPLFATLYLPIREPQTVAIICSGSGLEQRYYRHFAKYLSENGIAVITWDARGVGKSLNGQKVSEIQADYETWGRLDFKTIFQFAKQKFSNANLALVGHSFGGIYPFFSSYSLNLDAIITVATINGNINSMRQPLLARFITKIIQLKVYKIIPWKWIMGYDSPRGIIDQWAYWTLKENYFMSHPVFSKHITSLNIPILNIGMEDDEIGNDTAARTYHNFFHSSAIFREISPNDYHLNKIGHNGFFKRKNQKALLPEWNNIIDFLRKS